MNLTWRDTAAFELGIATLENAAQAHQLQFTIERDFPKLKKFLEARGQFVNPSFDRDHSDLSDADFWVRLVDRNGEAVACCAERVILTMDLRQLFASGEIWYRGGLHERGVPTPIPVRRLSTPFRGRIGHSGCGYIVPDWRRRGLALLVTWYARLVSFLNSETVISTGLIRTKLTRTTIPRLSYGFPHVEPLLDHFPPEGSQERMSLCWITRKEMVHALLELPQHPMNPMRLVPPADLTPLRAAA